MSFIKWDWKNREKKQEQFIKRCKKEKDMDEDEIIEILQNTYKEADYLIRRERDATTTHYHPFDLICGKIKQFEIEDQIEILGFEIKSDKDSFTRLGEQIKQYMAYCDRVYLVIHKKEYPKWLPNNVGVLRVSKKGEILEERYPSSNQWYDEVSGPSELKILMEEQGLGCKVQNLQKIFEITPKIWKKILFNRFFGKVDWQSQKFTKFFPFDKEELEFIIGHQLDYQLDIMKNKARQIKRLAEVTIDFIEKAKPEMDTKSVQKKLGDL